MVPGHGSHSNQVFLVGAHYDSVQNPGADDDASGVAGLLEAAKVLGDERFDRTLVFVAFDQEEDLANGSRLQGSWYFANTAKAAGQSIVGTLMLDMIAYNRDNSNVVTIGLPKLFFNGASGVLATQVADAYEDYTGLNVRYWFTLDRSDAYPFVQDGYPGVTALEPLNLFGPSNPYYHTQDDHYRGPDGVQTVNGRPYLDLQYATEMTKGAVAVAALKARLLPPSVPPAVPVPSVPPSYAPSPGFAPDTVLAAVTSADDPAFAVTPAFAAQKKADPAVRTTTMRVLA